MRPVLANEPPVEIIHRSPPQPSANDCGLYVGGTTRERRIPVGVAAKRKGRKRYHVREQVEEADLPADRITTSEVGKLLRVSDGCARHRLTKAGFQCVTVGPWRRQHWERREVVEWVGKQIAEGGNG